MKNGSLVLVEWEDSARPSPIWQHIDELPEPEVIACESVGWIISKDKKILRLAPNMGDLLSESNAQCSGVINIPMCSVQVIKILLLGDKNELEETI